jgi:hypothetical protein
VDGIRRGGAGTAVHIPVTLELSGDPGGVDLDALGREVEAAVVAQLRAAQRQLAAHGHAPAAQPAAVVGTEGGGRRAEPAFGTYSVPSYDAHGARKPVPVKGFTRPRTAIVRVAWAETWEDFYHRLVRAVSRRFRVPESELFQPLWEPGTRFHRSRHLTADAPVEIEVTLDYDPRTPAGTAADLRTPVRTPKPPAAPARPPAATPAAGPTQVPAPREKEPEAPAAKKEPEEGSDDSGYPTGLALFSTYLIRNGYIESVAGVIGPGWRAMSQTELTAYLSKHYTEKQLVEAYLKTYAERNAIKTRFRAAGIVAALVIGLVWAQKNLREGEWGTAIAKIGGTTLFAAVFNAALYARDPSAAALMARAPGNFGRWFQSAAKSNKFVNFLARDIAFALAMWQLKDLFMSGGLGGPNIPFDLIVEVDVDDPATWSEPDQTLLDLGFNIWYRQKATPLRPEAADGQLYLARVEGSATTGLLKLLDIAPKQLPQYRDKLFQVIGPWHEVDLLITSVAERIIREDEKVYVLSTGKRSGQLVSGRGHFRSLEVVPANEPAVKLFAGRATEMVPEYLLRPVIP